MLEQPVIPDVFSRLEIPVADALKRAAQLDLRFFNINAFNLDNPVQQCRKRHADGDFVGGGKPLLRVTCRVCQPDITRRELGPRKQPDIDRSRNFNFAARQLFAEGLQISAIAIPIHHKRRH